MCSHAYRPYTFIEIKLKHNVLKTHIIYFYNFFQFVFIYFYFINFIFLFLHQRWWVINITFPNYGDEATVHCSGVITWCKKRFELLLLWYKSFCIKPRSQIVQLRDCTCASLQFGVFQTRQREKLSLSIVRVVQIFVKDLAFEITVDANILKLRLK